MLAYEQFSHPSKKITDHGAEDEPRQCWTPIWNGCLTTRLALLWFSTKRWKEKRTKKGLKIEMSWTTTKMRGQAKSANTLNRKIYGRQGHRRSLRCGLDSSQTNGRSSDEDTPIRHAGRTATLALARRSSQSESWIWRAWPSVRAVISCPTRSVNFWMALSNGPRKVTNRFTSQLGHRKSVLKICHHELEKRSPFPGLTAFKVSFTPVAFGTDEPILVCALAGAEKTYDAILTILS
ncbi:hypothetical protein EV421DRAFT_2015403 [Armillaria borealis]|uniref:Uncharacterized protein n=1 Tax=Armillaria borealis TaxID=47425 RepID=A0AA39K355_9AGAR|nr:hypothetical protein EV421DRAFT_2015403 [Armillaria borealis]